MLIWQIIHSEIGVAHCRKTDGIMNLDSKGQNDIYGIFRHQSESKDDDLLRSGTYYVTQVLKGFMAPGYTAGISNLYS